MTDPPSINSRARKLYVRIQKDLEALKSAEGPERETVLLRISSEIGELAKLAESANLSPEALGHERSMRRMLYCWLARIAWKLLRIQSGTDFYTTPRGYRIHAIKQGAVAGSSDETASSSFWAVAA